MSKPSTDSEAPDPTISANGKGIRLRIPWRFASLIGAMVIGSGLTIVGVMRFIGVASASELQTVSTKNDAEHGAIQGKLKDQGAFNTAISGKVDVMATRLESVQTVQNRSIARDEARRVTAAIRDRNEREHEYDRLLGLNLDRLERGEDPCGTLACGR